MSSKFEAGPRPLVLDTSVVVKWYLPEALSREALSILSGDLIGHFSFAAPGTLFPELFNTFWQRYRRNLLEKNEVSQIWEDFGRANPITLYDPSDLVDRAAELVIETEIIIYDALFVALAEYLDTSVLTADQVLVGKLDDTIYQNIVIPLSEAPRLSGS